MNDAQIIEELNKFEADFDALHHDWNAQQAWLVENRKRLRELRDAEATQNPSGYITGACTRCGGTNIVNDANAQFNPPLNDFVLLSSFDNTDCLDCDGECSVYERMLSKRELAKCVEVKEYQFLQLLGEAATKQYASIGLFEAWFKDDFQPRLRETLRRHHVNVPGL